MAGHGIPSRPQASQRPRASWAAKAAKHAAVPGGPSGASDENPRSESPVYVFWA